ncbi:hypothetical protein BH23GEM11_BH23GEM11_04430 [soil metagenome]
MAPDAALPPAQLLLASLDRMGSHVLWVYRSLIAAALALSACQPAPEPAASDQTAVVEAAPAPALPEPESASVVPDTVPQDRTPETDPWLFEGIPNFEDLVDRRNGDWLVVLGSSRRSGAVPSPTIMASADAGLASIQQRAWNAGRVPFVVASEELPAFERGLTVVVLGPFARDVAERELTALRSSATDAYLKAGW